MRILDDGMAAKVKDKWTVYTPADVRNAWQAIRDYAHLGLLMADDEYRCLKPEDWQAVIEASDTSGYQYTPHFFDCNSFALAMKAEVSRLMVNGCGLVLDFSGRHAFNLAIIGGGKTPTFRFFEPQQDSGEWIVANSKACYNLKGNGLVYL